MTLVFSCAVRLLIRTAGPWLCIVVLALGAVAVPAAPITPTHDDEVIEVLPALSGSRAEQRRQRQALAQQPRNAALALPLARRYLAQAHEAGDPRLAGMALAAIAPWNGDAQAPDEVLLMRATLQQYLHEFDPAVATLQQLLARPAGAQHAQAWLTLATVRRVQGRYADSDAACQQVANTGAALHAQACLAENAGLRGELQRARLAFKTLLEDPQHPPATQAWLLTSLAELEQRAGDAAGADTAFQAALSLDRDPYTMLSYADLLIDQGQPQQALALLKDQPRTDAVLLRLAVAGARGRSPGAAQDAAEMRERIALANQRPDAQVFHGREQAMFALEVAHDAALALTLSQGNLAHQREPVDLLTQARAAKAAGNAAALAEVRRLAQSIGLVDQRLKAL